MMARVKGPLFSMSASGTIGKAIVFSTWKGREYVRRHAVPSNPRSGLQVGIRAVFGFIAQYFASLSTGEISDWEDVAAATSVTPLNAFTSDAVARARRNEGWRVDPDGAAAESPAAPTGGDAITALKSITLTWTDGIANGDDAADFCVAIHSNEGETADTPDISNLVGVVAVGTETFTLRGLTSGQAYSFSLVSINKDGSKGTAATVEDETPT
jgi:hypothetical protein